jgi:hypothetical protein
MALHDLPHDGTDACKDVVGSLGCWRGAEIGSQTQQQRPPPSHLSHSVPLTLRPCLLGDALHPLLQPPFLVKRHESTAHSLIESLSKKERKSVGGTPAAACFFPRPVESTVPFLSCKNARTSILMSWLRRPPSPLPSLPLATLCMHGVSAAEQLEESVEPAAERQERMALLAPAVLRVG